MKYTGDEFEIWKDVPNYEGFYQASTCGRIRSIDRIIVRSNKHIYSSKGKILSLCKSTNGYYIVRLHKNNINRTEQVHQLIAFTFLNHIRSKTTLVVDHKDFDKLNNNINNLQIISTRQNTSKKHIASSSRYTGVCWDKVNKRWKAGIRINGKIKNLGNFIIEEAAANAYEIELNKINKV